MVQQARQNEAEDRRLRERVEVRNNADNLAYQTDKALQELGDKVPAHERENIVQKVSALREALNTEDTDKIKRLSEDLQNAFNALSQQIYAHQQAEAQTASGHGGNGKPAEGGPADEGEVIEGEFHQA